MRITCGQCQFKLLMQMAMQAKIGPGEAECGDPEHAFSFGTVCCDEAIRVGSNRRSWSRESICGVYHPAEYLAEVLAAAWGESVAPSKIQALECVGLFDNEGAFTGFSCHRDDPADKLLDKLTNESLSNISRSFPRLYT